MLGIKKKRKRAVCLLSFKIKGEKMDYIQEHTLITQRIIDEKFKKGEIKNMYIPEVLEGLNEIEDFNERVETLRKNSERSLNTILLATFNDIRPVITSEDIESITYKPAYSGEDYSIAASTLFDVAKRFYVFYREDVSLEKMKMIAGSILENLHPNEADIFKAIFTGVLPYENITPELVSTAFPEFNISCRKIERELPEVDEVPEPPAKRIIQEDIKLPKASKAVKAVKAPVKAKPKTPTKKKEV
jgi:hypothetical protein